MKVSIGHAICRLEVDSRGAYDAQLSFQVQEVDPERCEEEPSREAWWPHRQVDTPQYPSYTCWGCLYPDTSRDYGIRWP